MTVITGIGGSKVRGVFSGCDGTVVAAHTGAVDRTVVDSRHRYPGGVSVAVLTGVRCVDVGGIFAGGYAAVMATDTRSRHVVVVKVDVTPVVGAVAIVTGI
ncbi:MAG: hypothetical protein AB8B81_11220 [Halioglobus sp.]